jgi:hypothetical protein
MGYGGAVPVYRKVERECSFASDSTRFSTKFDPLESIMKPWPAVLDGKATRSGTVKTKTAE